MRLSIYLYRQAIDRFGGSPIGDRNRSLGKEKQEVSSEIQAYIMGIGQVGEKGRILVRGCVFCPMRGKHMGEVLVRWEEKEYSPRRW